MALSLLCDEHIPHPIIEGLRRRDIDIISVQEIDLSSTDDALIMQEAAKIKRVIYTFDADFLRLHQSGQEHLGVLYHSQQKYSF